MGKTPKSTQFGACRIIISPPRSYSQNAQTGEGILPFMQITSVVSPSSRFNGRPMLAIVGPTRPKIKLHESRRTRAPVYHKPNSHQESTFREKTLCWNRSKSESCSKKRKASLTSSTSRNAASSQPHHATIQPRVPLKRHLFNQTQWVKRG